MPGKRTQRASKPSNGKGRAALGELDANVQPPTGAAPSGAGRPQRRQAAVKAGLIVTSQYERDSELDDPSPPQPTKSKVGRLAKSARDPSPTPGRSSRPSKRPKVSKSAPVPLESEADPESKDDDEADRRSHDGFVAGILAGYDREDSPSAESGDEDGEDVPSTKSGDEDSEYNDDDASSERLSNDELDDEALDDFDRPYYPCPENGDKAFEEDDDETDVEDLSDVESDSVDPSEDGEEDDAPISAKAKGKRPARTAAPVPKVAGSRRPKKARKRAPYKAPPSEFSAAEWLSEQNRKSGIKPDDPNVKRFQQLMSELVRRLSAKCHIVETGKDRREKQTRLNEILSSSTQRMLQKMEPTDICEAIFKHMPLVTQQILGKPNINERDLQGLPKGATQFRLPGTYLDVLGRFRPNQITREPHPDYKFKLFKDVRTLKPFVSETEALEIRLYLGSGSNTLWYRCKDHVREMNRPDNDKKFPEAAHYREFGNRKDVVPDFRVTSIWEPEDDGRFPKMTEGILMTYLGLQNSGKDSDFHPAETFEFNLELRDGLDLPDFMGISLNRAWPLFQGVGWPSSVKQVCGNPTHPQKWDGRMVSFCSKANGPRCKPCYEHFYSNGSDWPTTKTGKHVQVRASADARKRGCANPRHNEKWSAHNNVRNNQKVGGPRCDQCSKWIREHDRDYPFDKNGVDTATHPNLCQNVGHEAHWAYLPASLRPELNEFRCVKCTNWLSKEKRDYPYLTDGSTRRWICQNPGHPEGTSMFAGVGVTQTDGIVRCGACKTWHSKYGVDKPAKN